MTKRMMTIIITAIIIAITLVGGIFIGRKTVQQTPTTVNNYITEERIVTQTEQIEVHTVDSTGVYENGCIYDDDGNVFEKHLPNCEEGTRVRITYNTNNTFDRTDDEIVSISDYE